MKIALICIGKLREPFFKDAAGEYVKRIRKFVPIDIIEIEDDENRLNRVIENADYLMVLDERGKQLTSVEFANLLKEVSMSRRNLYMVIGSWAGISEEIKKRADIMLSLSKMTFPYQLARVIILEQIYRAFNLIKGTNYHK